MSDAKAVCLRCGNFVPQAPIAGIALCASCLEGTPPAKDNVFTYPPRPIVWKRIRPVTALGFALGCLGGFFAVREGLARNAHQPGLVVAAIVLALLIGGCGAVLGELTGFILLFVALPWNARGEWRRLLLTKLGLPGDSQAFSLVLLAKRAVKLNDLRMPLETGLLSVSEGGLVFLGERGTRFALPRAAIVKTSSGVMPFLPPRLATRLTLTDGREIFFVPLEARSPWESVGLVRALGARLQKSPA